MPDIEQLLAELTLEEKESLVNGDSMWTTPAVERLGIPALKVTDGPNGARGGGLFGGGVATLCIPCGSALGAMWNPELVESLGAALAEEAKAKGAHVLLAPTINLHRHPLGGRNFECYSEDPLLSGKTAAAFIRGVQGAGVATTPKHYAANDSEFERNTIDSVVDERALRELYLRPFEIAVREGGAWGIMAAYNRVNGTFCCENPWLLTDVLRGEWGFDGVVVTDWFAARSTAPSANAGLDWEMPGPGAHFGSGKLAAAVRDGEVSEERLDEMVRSLLVLMERTGAFERPASDDERELDRADQRSLVRRAAVEATVLLRNENVLPLDVSALSRVAVIGPNADRAQIMGGGSAALASYPAATPLEALRAALGPAVEVVHERGCDIERTAPIVAGPTTFEYYAESFDGDPVHVRRGSQLRMIEISPAAPIPRNWVARASATFEAPEAGEYRFCLVAVGPTTVRRGRDTLIDATGPLPRSDDLFGMGSEEQVVALTLEAGEAVDLVVETAPAAGGLGGFQMGVLRATPPDLMERAEAAAETCDAAVVVVGTNDDWETEGRDRERMELPGDQEELVRRVAAVNSNTIVAVNTGGPVAMEWADHVPAVLQIWFGGTEMAGALADVITGEASPSGHLPTTIPRDVRHAPSHLGFPGENSEVRYGESVFAGYRGYEAADRPVRFAFGHGLSTTTFEVGEPRPSRSQLVDTDDLALTVEVDVTNTGERAGATVVQLYVSSTAPALARPPKELAAFQKVWVEPGQRATAVLELNRRSFAYYDPGDPRYGALVSGSPVPAGGGGSHRTEPGWVIDAGVHTLHSGLSSDQIHHACDIEIVTDAT